MHFKCAKEFYYCSLLNGEVLFVYTDNDLMNDDVITKYNSK